MSYYTNHNSFNYCTIIGGTHESLTCELCGGCIKTLMVPSGYKHECNKPTEELYGEMVLRYKRLIEENKRLATSTSSTYGYLPYKNPNTNRSYKKVAAEWASKLTYDDWLKWYHGDIMDPIMKEEHIKKLKHIIESGNIAQKELDEIQRK